jgi:splicing factor, arginine/serine-rich 4/5/6
VTDFYLSSLVLSSLYRDVPNLSKGVRAEFARGDGRVKRKEDERRKNIAPSDTLFVVNFHEETTKKEDLEMLFEPFGELVRIDMKRNYAFVQFKTIAEATQAKETTNGGKLDQSVLTVEYVARQRESEIRSGGGGDRRGGGRGSRDGNRGGDRYDNHRRSDNDRRGGRPDRDYRGGDRGRSDNDRYSRGGGRRDNSPPPPAYRGGGGGGSRGGRSRSRSPPYGRSRSPPRRGYDDRYSDDYRRNNYRRGASPPDYHRRGPSPVGGSPPPPPRRGASSERYRGGDRERGYRG